MSLLTEVQEAKRTESAQVEDNKKTARRIIDEFFNPGDATVAAGLYTSDYLRHDPATPNETRGLPAIVHVLRTYRSAFPDVHFVIDDAIGQDDKVMLRWTVTGTHKGDLRGIAPTGKEIRLTGLTLYRLVGGKVAEEWTNWDAQGMMQQLGIEYEL